MKPYMALNDLAHQPVYRAPASGDRVQNMRAFGAFLEGSFDGIDLPLDASNPVQELLLITNDVCQLDDPSLPLIIYPGRYICQRHDSKDRVPSPPSNPAPDEAPGHRHLRLPRGMRSRGLGLAKQDVRKAASAAERIRRTLIRSLSFSLRDTSSGHRQWRGPFAPGRIRWSTGRPEEMIDDCHRKLTHQGGRRKRSGMDARAHESWPPRRRSRRRGRITPDKSGSRNQRNAKLCARFWPRAGRPPQRTRESSTWATGSWSPPRSSRADADLPGAWCRAWRPRELRELHGVAGVRRRLPRSRTTRDSAIPR